MGLHIKTNILENLHTPQIKSRFSDQSFLITLVVISTSVNVLLLYNKMFQHLKEIHNSVNQYFANISKLLWELKYLFKAQHRPMNFKFIELSQKTEINLYQTIFVRFWCNTKDYLKMLWKYSYVTTRYASDQISLHSSPRT